jgi:hypothetical protein
VVVVDDDVKSTAAATAAEVVDEETDGDVVRLRFAVTLLTLGFRTTAVKLAATVRDGRWPDGCGM